MQPLYTCLIGFFLMVSVITANGQITFTDQSSVLYNSNGFTSGIAVAVADMNGDGLDDIIRLDNGNMLSIEYQHADSLAFTNYTHGNIGGEAWALTVGDVDNDGYCDIMAGGYYDQVKVLRAMDNGTSFLSSTMPGPTMFVQGSNMADINNDGYLDLFVCHDDAESRIWGNDSTGAFFEADDWIDMATTPPSDNSGNYGSVWTDFDNDGDLDLYIAKCRQGVSNVNDPRRINALFVNDGHNNYTEKAHEFGLRINHQSWTADFQDTDNDGDMDCLITNHDYNLQLLENDGTGRFADISETAGLAGFSGGFLQGVMRDFDNDGFVDIITSEPTLLLRNNGDNTFSEISDPFGDNLSTYAVGDLNHDGFVDLYAAFACGINNPCGVPDKLFINDGNDNHFLAVRLQGVESNRLGIGARIEIHGSWGIQVREVRSGESYGIMNSLTKYFGLGAETEIEYLVVRWPSGRVDVLNNLSADQFLTVTEGTTCTLDEFELEVDGEIVLCPDETTTLTAPEGYTYLWSNGSVNQNITTGQAGNYSVVIVQDSSGCAINSNVVTILESEDETPVIEVNGDTEFCEGGSVELIVSTANGYSWSTGDTLQSIVTAEPGDYFVTVAGTCGDYTSEAVHVEVLETASTPVTGDVTIFDMESAILEATGANPHWYDSIAATVPVATGNIFETPVLSETTTYFVEDVNQYGGGAYETGMAEHAGSLFNGNTFNGQVLFDVYETVRLKAVTVTCGQAGIRRIELRNEAEEVLQWVDVDLPLAQSVVQLDFVIPPGETYRLTTNEAQNQQTLGTNSPRLYRSDEGVQYPYEVPGIISIKDSNYGSGFYYYFFNWQVEAVPIDCASERIPVTVNVEPNAVREQLPFGNLGVQPNPSGGQFSLSLQAIESGEAQLAIHDLTGRQLLRESFHVTANTTELRQVDLGSVPSGMYFLKVTSGERAGWIKLVVE